MSQRITTGNILRFFTACQCGRGWETEHALESVPPHVCNTRTGAD